MAGSGSRPRRATGSRRSWRSAMTAPRSSRLSATLPAHPGPMAGSPSSRSCAACWRSAGPPCCRLSMTGWLGRNPRRSCSAVVEVELGLHELQGACVLLHDPGLALVDPARVPRLDLDRDLQLGPLAGQVRQDLLLQLGELPRVKRRAHLVDADEVVLRPFPGRGRRWRWRGRSRTRRWCRARPRAWDEVLLLLLDRSGRLDQQGRVGDRPEGAVVVERQAQVAPGVLVVAGGQREAVLLPAEVVEGAAHAVVEHAAVT